MRNTGTALPGELVFVVGLLNWLRSPRADAPAWAPAQQQLGVWVAFDNAITTVRFNLQVRERELRDADRAAKASPRRYGDG